MNHYKQKLITCFLFLCLGFIPRASIADSSILDGIGIDRLKIGSTYEITLFSSTCFSSGSTIIRITKDECGYGLDGRRSTTNKYEKKKKTQYKVVILSKEQLDSLRSFEIMLLQLIRVNGLSGGDGCTTKGVYSINQNGKMFSYTDFSCELKLFPKLQPLLVESAE